MKKIRKRLSISIGMLLMLGCLNGCDEKRENGEAPSATPKIVDGVTLSTVPGMADETEKRVDSSTKRAGEWEYKIVNDEVTVTKYIGNVQDVVVPEEIDGKKVTCIGTCLFVPDAPEVIPTIAEEATGRDVEDKDGKEGVRTLTIPEGVKIIEEYAFVNCVDLEHITLPDSLTELGKGAFMACADMEAIELPEGITKLADNMFDACIDLEKVTLPQGITSIGNYVFANCESLERINVPEKVVSIGDYAFYGCEDLEKLTLPEGLVSIGEYAFYGCTDLKDIKLPESLTFVGEHAFENCTRLGELVLPEGVRKEE